MALSTVLRERRHHIAARRWPRAAMGTSQVRDAAGDAVAGDRGFLEKITLAGQTPFHGRWGPTGISEEPLCGRPLGEV